MIIFIRAIPELTKKSDLLAFVSPRLVNKLRFINGRVLNIEILVLQDSKIKFVEYHGLVTVDSEKAGRLAIKKLNGTLFKGKRVIVREYVERSWKNDRRENHANKFDPPFLATGKRRGDRRRDLELVKDISDIFTARKDSSRKLI